jgi:hypothetical protein
MYITKIDSIYTNLPLVCQGISHHILTPYAVATPAMAATGAPTAVPLAKGDNPTPQSPMANFQRALTFL